jgi:hypothetical protein
MTSSVPYADGMEGQAAALQELASAQPVGFVFATVNMRATPEVCVGQNPYEFIGILKMIKNTMNS